MQPLHAILQAHAKHDFARMAELAAHSLVRGPHDVNLLCLYGVALHGLDRLEEAQQALNSAVEGNPQLHEARLQLSSVLRKCGKLELAEKHLHLLHKYNPEDPRVVLNYSLVLNMRSKCKKSLAVIKRCLRSNPARHPGILINMANACMELGDRAQARRLCEEVLAQNGLYMSEATANLAGMDIVDGNTDTARQRLESLHHQGTAPAEAYLNLARLAVMEDKPEAALYWLEQDSVRTLHSPESIGLKVSQLAKLKKEREALDCLRDWLKHADATPDILATWLNLAQRGCFFDELVNVTPRLLKMLRKQPILATASLFYLLACEEVSALQLHRLARHVAPCLPPHAKACTHVHAAKQRLRVGYLSPDFRDHPVAHLMLGVLAAHDRSQVQVYAYNIGHDDHTVYRYRSMLYADEFRDMRTTSAEETARCIYDDNIDVLVDLCGYTEYCKPHILCYKPAPVIISYLGFVGTMGLPAVDYIIADSVVMPTALEPFHTEKAIRLPRCYQATDGTLKVEAVTRVEMGLPETAFVFVSFNNTYKLNPHFVALWAEILQHCPDAVLWLYASGAVQENLVAEFQRRGIHESRLYFFTRQPKGRFLGALALADLFLDSSPYNAGTTASDALFAGCPVLTLPGETYASRMCASILTHADLAELIADTDESYRRLACRMYADAEFRAAMRGRARQARHTRLFDTLDAARCLEAAYRAAYDRFASGKKPAPLTIPEIWPQGWQKRSEQKQIFAGEQLSRSEVEAIKAKVHRLGSDEAVEKFMEHISIVHTEMPQHSSTRTKHSCFESLIL